MDFLKGICATNSQKHSSEKRIMLDSKKLPKKAPVLQVKKFNGLPRVPVYVDSPVMAAVCQLQLLSEWTLQETNTQVREQWRSIHHMKTEPRPCFLCNLQSTPLRHPLILDCGSHTHTQNICDPAPPKVPVIIILCSQHILLTMFVHQ